MTDSMSRDAAVAAALDLIEPGTTIGLGSGRAVFALTEAAGQRYGSKLRVVAASNETAGLAARSGIELADLNDVAGLDIAFDGADEIDSGLRAIKGRGAAMLREKLVIEAARRVVILVEAFKLTDRLGTITKVPVEVIPFGWRRTMQQLRGMAEECELRDDGGSPKLTDENNFIIDVAVPAEPGSIEQFARRLKAVTGVVEHGLFLTQTTTVLAGTEDGTVTRIDR